MVGESKQRVQLSGVFYKTTVADFGKAELALDHLKGVLDPGAHAGLELLDSLVVSIGFQLGKVTAFSGPHGNVAASFPALSFFNASIPRVCKTHKAHTAYPKKKNMNIRKSRSRIVA